MFNELFLTFYKTSINYPSLEYKKWKNICFYLTEKFEFKRKFWTDELMLSTKSANKFCCDITEE